MKIAFWNVGGMGPNVQTKLDVFKNWTSNAKPDILFLSEVSAALNAKLNTADMMQMQWVSHPYKNGEDGTKDLAIFIRQGVQCDNMEPTGFERAEAVARERQQANLLVSEAKRDCARILVKFPQGVVVDMMGIHANASYSGGATAVQCADATIAYERNASPTMIGGDFNSTREGLTAGKTKKIVPLNWEGKELKFTQWENVDKPRSLTKSSGDFKQNEYDAYCKSVYVESAKIDESYKVPDPHNQIDYVLCSAGLNIDAVKNCSDGAEWLSILKNFDHAPVVYEMKPGAVA